MYFSRPFNDSVGRSFGYHGPFDRNLSDGKNPSTEKKKKLGKKRKPAPASRHSSFRRPYNTGVVNQMRNILINIINLVFFLQPTHEIPFLNSYFLDCFARDGCKVHSLKD